MFTKSKKGMQWLVGVSYAIIALVLIVGIGIVVLDKLNSSVACGTGFTYNATDTSCINSSGTSGFATSSGATNIRYGYGQLGSTGLLGWLPAIIALVIGLFFLASFMGKKKDY